jgi:anion-transporting  ArsA/GET3 family ATPase
LIARPERSLLAHRLVIVTGKGGTGKTTVAATLALAASQAGRRVLVAEVGRDEHLPRLLVPGAPPVGYSGRTLAPGLHAVRIDPYDALAEYLALQVGMRPLVGRVLRNRGFRQLMDASPGWRELITLGKVWHFEQMCDDSGAPLYDLVVVDAPATGHGLTFLDVPRVVVSALRAGPLRRHAEWVEELVRDSERTLLLPVTLAEELPARETIELVDRVRNELRIAVDRVVVNAVVSAPFPADLADLDTRLERLPPIPGLPPAGIVAACARFIQARFELHRRYTEEIVEGTGLPPVVFPFLEAGVRGPDDLGILARCLAPLQAAA